MGEKVRFYNMTKPVKFRRIKIIKQMVVLWCGGVRERIIYFFNYILYKLNILKRYSYRDNVVKVLPLPYELKEKSVTCENFGGLIKMQLVSHNNIDLDYFYFQKKDGSKKITLSLKDKDEQRMFVESHLENIHIKVGKWFSVDHLPVFKVVYRDTNELTSYSGSENTKPVEVKTVEYDISKLKNLCYKSILGSLTVDDISEEMLNYYYECSCREFKEYLNTLTLHDLML